MSCRCFLTLTALVTFAASGQADPMLPTDEAGRDAQAAAQAREAAESLVKARMHTNGGRGELQELAGELRTLRSLLLATASASAPGDSTGRLSESLVRLKSLMAETSRKAPGRPHIQAIEPALRSRFETLTPKLEAILAETDPARRRGLALALRGELEGPSPPRLVRPTVSQKLERKDLGTSTLQELRSRP